MLYPDANVNFLLWAVCLGLVGFGLRHGLAWLVNERKRKALGCGSIPRYPQWDPVFGLDLAWSQMQALRNHYYIPWLRSMHHGRPKTFSTKFLGTRQIYTTEPENLKALTALVWKDFGIAPLRRFKNMGHPFGERGVNTVDGKDWEFSRFLIKPFFNRDVYTSTERLEKFTDHFIRLLPPDGQTFNIQPNLQRWVRFPSPFCFLAGRTLTDNSVIVP